MYGKKIKVLDELIDHLNNSQGDDLHSLLEESRKSKEMESPELGPDGKPKGLKIESVEIMGKKPDFNDMANDAMADASDSRKTLGETIGYPGFIKKKPTALLEEGMGDHLGGEKELDDDELEELIRKYV